jgi:hypothetical protein
VIFLGILLLSIRFRLIAQQPSRGLRGNWSNSYNSVALATTGAPDNKIRVLGEQVRISLSFTGNNILEQLKTGSC